MAFAVLTDVAASIDNLKRNPMRVIREGAGEAVLILHRNKPAFYAVPPALYEAMLEIVGDGHLAGSVCSRGSEYTVQQDISALITQSEMLSLEK